MAPNIPISIFHPKNASVRNRSDLLYRLRDDVECWEDVGGEIEGDHARRAVLVSREGGRPMLRWISKVVRQRIWRRPLERQAEWVALGERTAVDVAGGC